MADSLIVGHLADIHLGTRKYGGSKLVLPPGYTVPEEYSSLLAWDAARMLEASLEALTGEDVRHVLLSGDVFDVPRPDNRTLAWAGRLFRRYTEGGGVRIIAVPGDHDTPGGRDATPLDTLSSLIPGFHLLRAYPGVSIERSLRLDAGDAVFYGLPYVRAGVEKRRLLTRKLSERLAALGRADESLGKPRILLAHYGLTGYTHPDDAIGHPQELPPVDYAAMGHVHARHLRADWRPPFAYPGSLVPLSLDEARQNYKRGPLLVEVEAGAGRAVVSELAVEPPRSYHVVEAHYGSVESEVARAIRGARSPEPPLVHVVLVGVPGDVGERLLSRDLAETAKRLNVIVRLARIVRARRNARVAAGEEPVEASPERLELELLKRHVLGDEGLARDLLRLKEALIVDPSGEAVHIIRDSILSEERQPVWARILETQSQDREKPAKGRSRRPRRGRRLDDFLA